ncbi:galanin receptor 2a-like [Montipora capricornis]|uniref:galanin receptor 2a-like n=1 Tax=Montipora capricornis TaxID=246305 RepID=UPI0035F1CA81
MRRRDVLKKKAISTNDHAMWKQFKRARNKTFAREAAQVVTESGTGTWDVGLGDLGTWGLGVDGVELAARLAAWWEALLQLQSHLSNQQVVVRCNVHPSPHSRVLQASPELLVDGDVVNLVDCAVVGRHPGALVDVLVLEHTSTYHQVVEHAKNLLNLLIGGILGVLFCKVANFIEKLCMNVAILHLSMIAIDRLLVVFYPYKKIITKKRALWMIITAWLASAVFCAPLLYYANTLEKNGQTKCKTRNFFPNWRVWYVVFLSLLMLTLVFVISLYVAITIHVRASKRPGKRVSDMSNKNARLRSRILKMVLLIVLAFYICFLPYWMGWFFCVYFFTGLICNDTYVFISIFLIYANSAINLIIYSFFNENFRLAFRTILGRLCGCYRSSQESMVTAFEASNDKKENPRQNSTQIRRNPVFLEDKTIESTRV